MTQNNQASTLTAGMIDQIADDHKPVVPPSSGNGVPDVSKRKPPRKVVQVPIKEVVLK